MARAVERGGIPLAAPGGGALIAASFVSVIDDAKRFKNADQVESYIGLVPAGAKKSPSAVPIDVRIRTWFSQSFRRRGGGS